MKMKSRLILSISYQDPIKTQLDWIPVEILPRSDRDPNTILSGSYRHHALIFAGSHGFTTADSPAFAHNTSFSYSCDVKSLSWSDIHESVKIETIR